MSKSHAQTLDKINKKTDKLGRTTGRQIRINNERIKEIYKQNRINEKRLKAMDKQIKELEKESKINKQNMIDSVRINKRINAIEKRVRWCQKHKHCKVSTRQNKKNVILSDK